MQHRIRNAFGAVLAAAVWGLPCAEAADYEWDSSGWNLNWIEFEQQFYSADGIDGENLSDPEAALTELDGSSLSLEWSGVEGATYSLQRSTDLADGFSTVESGIPVHSATNASTLAMPDDAGFYRVILE